MSKDNRYIRNDSDKNVKLPSESIPTQATTTSTSQTPTQELTPPPMKQVRNDSNDK